MVINKTRSGKEKLVKVTKKTVEFWESLDRKLEKLAKKFSIPFLTIHGTKDQTISLVDATTFSSTIINSTLHLVEGADHNFIGSRNDSSLTYHEEVVSTIISWLSIQSNSLHSFIRAHNTEHPFNSHIIMGLENLKSFRGESKFEVRKYFPKARIIAVEGVQNFRDFGGYPVGDLEGRIVRPGVLFRSGM
ncbi:hypothetical protein HK096_005685 [Nowakowskiella sp. JEL0078]|nr:hypothetical protein HK096_005685 [Nowakowskiella sp. JEL0078]